MDLEFLPQKINISHAGLRPDLKSWICRMIQLPNQEVAKPWVLHHKAYTYMNDKSIIVA